VSVSGRRVVFDRSGTINLLSEVAIANNTTIDGTTAPSPGVTIHGQPVSTSNRNNIIIRNLRFREDIGGPSGKCSLQGTACSNIIIDHCSIEWGRWDTMEFTGNSHDITVQWCIIGVGIDPQYFSFLVDAGDRISIHHNLFVDSNSRNPKLKANAQYINNVVYNWGSGGCLVGGHSSAPWNSDVINNYFMSGPSSTAGVISQCNSNDVWYVSGNFKDTNKNGVWDGTAMANSDFTSQGVTLRGNKFHNPTFAVTVDTASHCVNLATGGFLGCQPNDSVDKTLTGYVKSYGTQGKIGQ